MTVVPVIPNPNPMPPMVHHFKNYGSNQFWDVRCTICYVALTEPELRQPTACHSLVPRQ